MSNSPNKTNSDERSDARDVHVRLVCPQCKAKYRTNQSTAGRRVRCFHCGNVWRDERRTLPNVAGALGKAASAWSQLGSTTIAAGDHASTMGDLVAKAAGAPKPPSGEWVGRKIGRYQIKAVLGQGAMGYVYEAFDPDLQRTVALKLLPRRVESKESPVSLRMFLQEARIAARLQHPNIVTIHEVGSEDGYYYFAMERVGGTTLHTLVHAYGSLPAQQACYVIAQVARALAAGHEHGVVHRDVKPGNIMIDDAGQVKVTDFGLADLQGVGGVPEMSERAMGTPGWISPEVAREERATPASDIYGLGLTLCYILTGNRLIKAETKSGMIRSQRHAKSIRREDLPDDLPPRLKDILVQCLQADPSDRYKSANSLAADLLRALSPGDRDATVILDHASNHEARRLVSPVLGWVVLGLLLLVAAVVAVWFHSFR